MSKNSQAAGRPRLSVAMIVRDAEHAVAATIESAKAIADEVLVVDTGSKDATAEAARRAGAKVIDYAWDDDFSAARNHGLAHVGGDWVLWLDAGETLAAETACALRAFIDHQADPAVAYLLMVEIPPAEGHVSGEQAARVRMIRADRGLSFRGRVRETLLPAIADAGMTVQVLDSKILRTAAEHDPAMKARRAERDLRLARLEIGEHGERAEVLLAQGQALATLSRHSEAVDHYRRAIALTQRGSTEMLEAYYGVLTSLEREPETQWTVCLEALEVFPLDAQLLSAMGGYMLAANRADLAVRSYRIALDHGQIDPVSWHLSDIGPVCATYLSLTLQLQGQTLEARTVLEQAIQRYPDSLRLRHQLRHSEGGRSADQGADLDRPPADSPSKPDTGHQPVRHDGQVPAADPSRRIRVDSTSRGPRPEAPAPDTTAPKLGSAKSSAELADPPATR